MLDFDTYISSKIFLFNCFVGSNHTYWNVTQSKKDRINWNAKILWNLEPLLKKFRFWRFSNSFFFPNWDTKMTDIFLNKHIWDFFWLDVVQRVYVLSIYSAFLKKKIIHNFSKCWDWNLKNLQMCRHVPKHSKTCLSSKTRKLTVFVTYHWYGFKGHHFIKTVFQKVTNFKNILSKDRALHFFWYSVKINKQLK